MALAPLAVAPSLRLIAVAVIAVCASGRADAAKVLVVPAAGDASVEAGVRDGVGGVPDAEVADAAAVAALMEGAKSAGIACAADDGACWLRLAALGGLDHVVFVSGSTVTHVTAKETTSSAAFGAGQAAFAAACRRAFGLEAAVRITAVPTDAAVTFDNKAVVASVAGGPVVVEGVVPGAHVVGGSAVGYAPQLVTVTVPAGSVTDAHVALVAEAPPPPPLSTLTLVGGVVGGLGAAAFITGLGLGSYGEVASPETCTNKSDNAECVIGRTGWITAIAGGLVGAVGGVVAFVGL